MCTTDSKIIAFSFIVEVKGRRGRPEISVAEEMRRQKEEQEMRDRGGCGSKVAMGIKFTHSMGCSWDELSSTLIVAMATDNAKYAVEFYLRGDDRFKMMEYLPDMGK